MRRRRSIALGVSAALAGLCSALVASPAFADPVVTQATGPSPASIQGAVNQFRSSLGQPIPPGTPPQAGGFRNIGWDGGRPDPDIPASNTQGSNAFSDPFFMPEGQFRGFGAVFSTPGRGLMLSADPDSTNLAPPNYGRIDASYQTTFAPFSAPRLFTSIDSNVINVRFVIPQSDTDAQTSGFGVIFSDVNIQGPTTIEYFAPNGRSYGSFPVPATPGNQTFSFLGVRFDGGEQVARARITLGNAALAAGVVDAGNTDLVVTDDFMFGEPQAQDLRRPGVRITRQRIRQARRAAIFRFRSRGASAFECKLNRRGPKNRRFQRLNQFRPCDSPQRYQRLTRGRGYVFAVRAVDPSFIVGRPARATFRIRR